MGLYRLHTCDRAGLGIRGLELVMSKVDGQRGGEFYRENALQ